MNPSGAALRKDRSLILRVISGRLKCMYLDLDHLEEYVAKHMKEFAKIRNLYLYKKLAIEIEEVKFNDIVVQVLDKMIELRQRDTQKESNLKKYEIHQLKSKKAAVFNNLLQSALNSVIYDHSDLYSRANGKSQKHEILASYFETMFPHKKIEGLEKLRKKIVKQNDALKCGGVSPFLSPKRVPI